MKGSGSPRKRIALLLAAAFVIAGAVAGQTISLSVSGPEQGPAEVERARGDAEGGVATTQSQAERSASLFVTYGSMVLSAVFIVVGVLTAMAGFSVAQSSRATRESSRVLQESRGVLTNIQSIQTECAGIRSNITSEFEAMKRRLEDTFVDSALRDLGVAGADPAGAERRQIAIRILGEVGRPKHVQFLAAALEKSYENEDNKRLIRQAIERVGSRYPETEG